MTFKNGRRSEKLLLIELVACCNNSNNFYSNKKIHKIANKHKIKTTDKARDNTK